MIQEDKNIIRTNISNPDECGLLVLTPTVYKDPRGYFFESYSQRDFDKKIEDVLGHPIRFVQDNESMSSYGVMRGLHYQKMPYTQSKLVRCIRGAVLDVAVDIRNGSPSYGKYFAVKLTEENKLQFFIPRGFAHGFAVLSDTAIFQYKCDAYYHPESDAGINIMDKSLGIDWELPLENIILSDKDKLHPNFLEMPKDFDFNENLYPEFTI